MLSFQCFSAPHSLVYSDPDADSDYIYNAALIVNLSLTLIRNICVMLLPLWF